MPPLTRLRLRSRLGLRSRRRPFLALVPILVPALVLVLALAWPVPKAFGQGQETLPDSDYARLAQRHGLQDHFPDGTAAPRPEPVLPDIQIASADLSLNDRLILGLLLAILAVAGVLVIRNSLAYRRARQRLSPGTEPPGPDEIDLWGMVPDDSWEALLHRFRLRSDYRSALHDMLLAAIGFCQQELALHIPRARTPREIQDALPAGFAATQDFHTLVQGAERAWFGAKPVDRAMFLRSLEALSRVLSQKP